MNYRDVSMVDNSLDQLGDTLLKQRMMKQQDAQSSAETARAQQNTDVQQDLARQRLKIEQQNADSESAYRKQEGARADKIASQVKPYYVYSNDGSGNVLGTFSSYADADTAMQRTLKLKPDSSLYISGDAPEGRVLVTAPDGTHIYVKPENYAATQLQFQKASQMKDNKTGKTAQQIQWADKQDEELLAAEQAEDSKEKEFHQQRAAAFGKLIEHAGSFAPPKGVIPSQTITEKQVPSPMGGTNAPSVLKTTTTKMPLNIPGTDLPDHSTNAVAKPKGVRVRNKKTGQMGTQLPDGSVIPDPA